MPIEDAVLEIQGPLAVRVLGLAAGGGVLNDAVGVGIPIIIGAVNLNSGKAAARSAAALV